MLLQMVGNDVVMDHAADSSNASAIQELQAQHVKFNAWFQEVGNKVGSLEGKLEKQDAQLQEVRLAVNEQAAASSSLQKQLSGIQTAVRADIDHAINQQTSRLEALLEKRAKTS